jgi:hypothetical protein
VFFALKRASIDLHFKNCQPAELYEYPTEEYRREDVTKLSEQNVRGGGMEANARSLREIPSASATVKIGGNVQREKQSTETRAITRLWKPVGLTTIQVNGYGAKLDGEAVSNVKRWFVKPDTSKDFSAIVAILSTRANWIEFGQILDDSTGGGIGNRLKRWLRSKKNRDRALFDLLLRTLASKGLQSGQDKDATLAMHIQILRKTAAFSDAEERPMVIPGHPATRAIGVDSSLVNAFLDGSTDNRVELLRGLGVPRGDVESALISGGSKPKRKLGPLFNAGSAPFTALEALNFVLSFEGPISPSEWEEANKNRSRADLAALELIEIKDGLIHSCVKDGTDAEVALRHAAMRAPMLQKTRELLLEKPNITSIQIGEELRKEFNRNYNSEASKLRVGGAMRRWAIWLEPHLVEPDAVGRTASLRVSATSKTARRGAPSLATSQNIERAQAALDAGQRPEDVAKMIGISRASIYLWDKKGLISFTRRAK